MVCSAMAGRDILVVNITTVGGAIRSLESGGIILVRFYSGGLILFSSQSKYL